jgi:hypothetical protein
MMIGNTYKFDTFFNQAMVYDISFIDKDILGFEIFMYQNNSFTLDSGELFSPTETSSIII